MEVTSCSENERSHWEVARALMKCLSSAPWPKYPAQASSSQQKYWPRRSIRLLKRGLQKLIFFSKSPSHLLLWSLSGSYIFFTKVVEKLHRRTVSQMDINLHLTVMESKWNKGGYNHWVSIIFWKVPSLNRCPKISTFCVHGLSHLG